MGELREITEDLCKRCKYSANVPSLSLRHCYYIRFEHHSRRLKDGKPYYPSGYCDKFTEGRIENTWGKGKI